MSINSVGSRESMLQLTARMKVTAGIINYAYYIHNCCYTSLLFGGRCCCI